MSGDWMRLATAIERRLGATGATVSEVAAAAGLSRETVRPILNAVPGNYRPATLAKVSLALGWTGDSIERVLAGGKPRLAPQDDQSIEDRITELEARFARIESAIRDRLDPGDG